MPDRDAAFMERALSLAALGRGRTSPNPSVGAVVVSPAGIVVGHGTTRPPGGAHAEVVALDEAGDRARGATLYCTLEPCTHHGRTGPCVDRIIAAGVARVVVAIEDRNPRVKGGGIARLRASGIGVDVGIGRAEAGRQYAPFFTWAGARRPFVIAKMAVSQDGYVGRRDARVKLTGAAADRFFHRQRAEVDAIAVGAGTMLTDDPLLTPRGAFRARPLTRVIVDWRGRVPESARIFGTAGAGPIIVVMAADAAARAPAHIEALAARGVVVDVLADRALDALLTRLAERDIVTLLVEGGPALHAAFAEADFVDRVERVTTPIVLGGGVPAADHWRLRAPEDPAARVETTLGADRLVEFDVHGTD